MNQKFDAIITNLVVLDAAAGRNNRLRENRNLIFEFKIPAYSKNFRALFISNVPSYFRLSVTVYY